MNREAALLGVPTYSVFTGRRPAMDEYLASTGRLTFLDEERAVDATPVARRSRPASYEPANRGLAGQIADLLVELSGRPK
jgi:predicted glycosyltransferase